MSQLAPLLTTDLKAFMACVMRESFEERRRDLHTIDDRMVCEALHHGIFNERSALPRLMQLYEEEFLKVSVGRGRLACGCSFDAVAQG
jgi:hypothetical protein